MKFTLIFTLLISTTIFTSKLPACTGALINSTDGSIVTGRTVEFGPSLIMSVAIVPRNMKFVGQTSIGSGMTYVSKYAFSGVYCFSDKVMMDGMNEKGLVAAAFFFPGYASYTPTTAANQASSLSPLDFTNWILSQFSTIEEVIEAIPSVSISPTVFQSWGKTPPPFHYVVYDSQGKSIVIEPLDGKLVVYENLIGTITNSPTFDWHLTNLDNYIHLTPFNNSPIVVRGLKLQDFGQGSGLKGLPGDFSSTSRFVRSTVFSTTMIPPDAASQLPNQAFHLLNQFDIPFGAVREKSGGSVSYDYTQLTTVKDPNTLRYYFKSYSDQSIRFIDLQQFDLNANSIKSMTIQGEQVNADVSSSL